MIKAVHGADGHIRSVLVRKADGAEGLFSLRHLYPLELSLASASNVEHSEVAENEGATQSAPSETDVVTDTDEVGETEAPPPPTGRPERKAAKRARTLLKGMAKFC